MKLKIVTPERLVIEEDVEAVYAKAPDGYFGVLPKHVPLVTPLEIGVLRFVQEGKDVPLAVMGGLLRTDGHAVTVLTDAAELSGEIDTVRAQQAKERAEARMKETLEDIDVARTRKALARATTRLRVSNGSK